jgi:hypothetical protein
MTSRFYVYSLGYPNGEVFYIGKGGGGVGGIGSRIHSHTWQAKSGKAGRRCDIIRSILATGETVLTNILFETDDEGQAYKEEIRLISLFDKDKLVNVPHCSVVGRRSKTEPLAKMAAYLPAELKLEVERQAAVLGQPISTYVERALTAYVIQGKEATT